MLGQESEQGCEDGSRLGLLLRPARTVLQCAKAERLAFFRLFAIRILQRHTVAPLRGALATVGTTVRLRTVVIGDSRAFAIHR
jgi:hypothetical protein